MKVLFHAYNTCCQSKSGGVQVRIKKIKALLEERGIQVDFFNPYSTDIRDYDLVHIFMLTLESEPLISCAKSLGKKVVLSSIVNLNNYKSAKRNHRILPVLCRLGVRPTDSVLYKAIHQCDGIIAETPAEAKHLQECFDVSEEKFRVIPNGCEEPIKASDEIYDLIGSRKKYVLQVGRIDPNKNLLNIIKAVRGANYNLVVIGGEYAGNNSGYIEKCKKEATGCDNVIFLGWLSASSKELSSAYANAQALVLPSYQETFGLVAIEAAAYGTHVCLSNTLPILEFGVFDKELSFNPNSPSEIRSILDKAINIPKNEERKKVITDFFNWDRIIDLHIDLYKQCLNK